MTFTQLQVQSSYSLLQSPLTIDQLIKGAVAGQYAAVALTDTNVVYGLVDFYTAAQNAGIKPLLGLTVSIAEEQFILIAETTAGYHQLLKISTTLMLDNNPTLADLPDFNGLALMTTAQSQVSQRLQADDAPGATVAVEGLLAKQPSDFYIGLSPELLQSPLPEFAHMHQYPLIALGDVSYARPQDAFTQTVLRAVGAGETLNFRDPTLQNPGQHWLQSQEAAAEPFVAAGFDQAVTNANQLAAKTDVTIAFRQPQLPHYKTPDGQPAIAYLTQLAQAGLAKRFADGQVPPAYQQRLDYELEVIAKMGFADYFLVVWDVMNHAHEVGITTGPGRGSAAGALVSYALAITEVDPIAYNLLFERFLNPNRANMPDIDLDIPDNRRGELLQYTHDKYGTNHMAQIITFGTFGAKQALRDVARVFGLSQYDSNLWSRAIPNGLHVDLSTAYEQSQPLKNLVADSQRNQLLFETAKAIEGLPRHYSTHAAGIVLSEEPLTDTVALQVGSDGIEETQLPMGNVEALGLLKMDFLGLRNLSILASASYYVSQATGKPFDPKQIPLDDAQTLALFAAGDTNGVFQFESSGIKNVLRKLKPTQFEDVVAVNALYRPGPMENIDTFIARKNGQEPVTYPDPVLEPILAPTYGVLVYQEQVMQVASTMGGFSLGEADLLRRAMSKKKADVLASEQQRFIEGAVAKGFSKDTATTVYAYIDRFANYGFNRSHAVAYSMVAFWLAYLKTHYPAAFFTALLNSSLNNTPKLRTYIQEAKTRHVKVLGPDINRSGRYFQTTAQEIRFGLLSIKGTRRDFVDAILAERKQGPFKSLQQFLQRLDTKWQKAATLEPLVYAGAFDQFDQNRAQVRANLDELIESVKLSGDNVTLFEVLQPKPVTVPEMSLTDRLDKEAEVLGVYLSGHPVEKYAVLKTLMPIQTVATMVADSLATLIVQVRAVKTIRTKTGKEMAFVDGQDETGPVSITIFPNLYPQFAQLDADKILVVSGKVEINRDNLQLVANRIQLADELMPQARLFIQLPEDFTDERRADLLKTLQKFSGSTPVITVEQNTRQSVLLARQYWVDPSETALASLQAIVGAKQVVLQPVNGDGR
ncbi:DNA polymerase III subunit alpha [Lacticaseibacillus brantae]|uniref:DNA polymerase III subunit alpha n=1 Tax=Lacticaseibacillus brantae DSM 23927 TaxID=1423727 RepID=A0A0R2B896_9LACO|nr:DNA polymerase III subunit alpha [Lacticaseibacillus brantae]KRM72585.1 DNA-directed DNA polymerase III subunit alpha [Lacticaseibacillus brantae DSM 23927]